MHKYAAALLAAALAAGATSPQAEEGSRRVFISGYGDPERWCAFSSQRAAAETAGEEMLLTLVEASGTPDGAVSALSITWGPESGDWLVADVYRLSGDRTLRVSRSIGYAQSGQKQAEQVFERVGDRLLLRRQRSGTGYLPVERPYARVSDAPFYALLRQAAAMPALPTAGLCAAGG